MSPILTSGGRTWKALLAFERGIVRVERALVLVLFLGMSTFVLAGIVFRILSVTAPWTNEVSQLFLVWLMFVGANLGTYYREHVGVTILPDRTHGRTRIALVYAAQVALIIFSAYILVAGTKLVLMQRVMGGTTFSLPIDIPTYLISLILPFSFLFGTLHSVRELVEMDPSAPPTGPIEAALAGEASDVKAIVGST
ncbi:MAG: TRAP transporter small permease [Casimicrobiaceae bacterium]